MRVGRAGWIVVAAIAARGPRAAAEPRPTVQLRYAPPGAPTTCPAEPELRDAIASRLGYDPFAPDAPRTVVVTIADDSAGLHADIALRDAADHELGTRQLAAAEHDCRELAAAIALAVSVAIDPLSASRPVAAPVPPPRAPPPASPSTRARAPIHLRAGLGGLASLGAEPGVSGGLTAEVGAHVASASLALEGRVDLPASTTGTAGTVRSSVLLAALVPCAHRGHLVGCAVLALGAMQGSGVDVAAPHDRTTFYGAAGIRLGTEIPLTGAFALAVHVDVLATLTRTSLMLDASTVWTTPPVSGVLAIGVVGDFL